MFLDLSPELEFLIEDVKIHVEKSALVEADVKPKIERGIAPDSIGVSHVYLDTDHYISSMNLEKVRFPSQVSIYSKSWKYTEDQKPLLRNIESRFTRKMLVEHDSWSIDYYLTLSIVYNLVPVRFDGLWGLHFSESQITSGKYKV